MLVVLRSWSSCSIAGFLFPPIYIATFRWCFQRHDKKGFIRLSGKSEGPSYSGRTDPSVTSSHHGHDVDIRCKLRLRRSKICGFLLFLASNSENEKQGSWIFGVEDRRLKIGGSSIFQLRKSKLRGCTSIFRCRRLNNPHTRSSKPKVEENIIFKRRYLIPKIEEPTIFDLWPEK